MCNVHGVAHNNESIVNYHLTAVPIGYIEFRFYGLQLDCSGSFAMFSSTAFSGRNRRMLSGGEALDKYTVHCTVTLS